MGFCHGYVRAVTEAKAELVRALQKAALHTPTLIALSNEAREVHDSLEAVRELDDVEALKLGADTSRVEQARLEELRAEVLDAVREWFQPTIEAYSLLNHECRARIAELSGYV